MRPTIFLLVLPRRKTVPRPVPERRGRQTRETMLRIGASYSRLSDLILLRSVVYTLFVYPSAEGSLRSRRWTRCDLAVTP